MNKTKLIIHERFNGKQSLENVFLSAFQSESCQLIQDNSPSIMGVVEFTESEWSETTGDNHCLSLCWKSRRLEEIY